jgi:hypothetical protein
MTERGGADRRGSDRRHLVSVEQIGDMLRERVLDLCTGPWALQRGAVDGQEYVALNPLRHDRNPGSFRVCLAGQYKGLVKDFATGESWSPLQFSAALLCGGRIGDAIKWARAWLGVDGADPAALATARAVPSGGADPAADAEAAEKDERRRKSAHALWLSAQAIAGTPAAAYLAGRGIDVDSFDFPLGSLHYHPECWSSEAKRPLPAMLAAVTRADGRFAACHRTYLEPCRGGWRKAALAKPKMVLGRFAGASVRLWGGVRVDPKTGEVRKGRKLAECPPGSVEINVTEGIENGLSVALACPEWRVAAAVSLSNMRNLRFPPSVSAVTLWRDNDPPGGEADTTFGRAAQELRHRGLKVAVVCPPENFKDMNEWLQAELQRGEAVNG